MSYQNKSEELEMLVLELGAEVFRIKTQMDDMKGLHSHFVEVISNLKKILDEKGLINTDDFEEVADWDKIQLESSAFPLGDSAEEATFAKLKKNLH